MSDILNNVVCTTVNTIFTAFSSILIDILIFGPHFHKAFLKVKENL